MLKAFWNFLTSSFCCHDCRRLKTALDDMTRDYIVSLRRLANTRQLYEKDGDAIAGRLHALSRQLQAIHKLIILTRTKLPKKRRK